MNHNNTLLTAGLGLRSTSPIPPPFLKPSLRVVIIHIISESQCLSFSSSSPPSNGARSDPDNSAKNVHKNKLRIWVFEFEMMLFYVWKNSCKICLREAQKYIDWYLYNYTLFRKSDGCFYINRYKKCADIWKVTSSGRAEIQNVNYFQFQLLHQCVFHYNCDLTWLSTDCLPKELTNMDSNKVKKNNQWMVLSGQLCLAKSYGKNRNKWNF